MPVVGDSGMREGLMMGRTAALAPAEQVSGENYLPPTRHNVDLVGQLQLQHPDGGPPTPDFIADVSVLKNTAYLAGWSEGIFNEPCTRGGLYSVDISNPAQPTQLAFEPALEQNYHGEGVHAIPVDSPEFEGDLLAVNNETCTATTTPPNQNVPEGGGFDLYDVSNPADPVLLSRANGDYTVLDSPSETERIAHEAHSVFLWQDGQKVYAVIVDNQERFDIDIYDVTNPREGGVERVAEFDLDERFPEIAQNADGQGNFASNNLHDMVVKEINGVQTMLVSYWDAGYVTLNVEDPANPTLIGDSDFDATDPFTGFTPPEGNGHQAEFSHDNKYILAADEDFDTFRLRARITEGQHSGFEFQQAGGADRGTPVTTDTTIEGDTRFFGTGCTAATDPANGGPLPPSNGGVTIAVFERGICSFQEKVQQADDAGYDTAIIFNNFATADEQRCDTLLGMTLGTYSGDVTALFVARSVGFRIIDADMTGYFCNNDGSGTGTPAPAAPREGLPLDIGVDFDGWGYAHQFTNNAGKLQKVDDYAIQEGVDDRWSSRFGDLSIHEFATDPATNLAYTAYYSGGFRVVRFDDAGIEEVGRFIDQRSDGKGNDFWGVEQFTAANGERLAALSDRDYGLYIFRYTGPGAVGPKQQGATPPPPAAAPPPAASGPQVGRCANVLATIAGQRMTGTAFGDEITGTEGPDTIDAAAGDDCIAALGGNDDLRGGTGVDTIDGQRGNDRIRGDAGRGNLRGGSGNDRVTGSAARDALFGNTGRDRLSGGGDRDQLFGGAGRDRLTGGRGRDVLEAGTGNDRIFAKDGSVDRIDCGFGRDTVVSRDRKDKLTSCENR